MSEKRNDRNLFLFCFYLLAACSLGLAACDKDDESDGDTDSGSDTDSTGDTDSDSDTDSAGDTDSDSDTDSASDSDTEVAEYVFDISGMEWANVPGGLDIPTPEIFAGKVVLVLCFQSW